MAGNDFRAAVRLLVRTPALTVPAIASLALGIAVNTTLFSVVDALLFRPLVQSIDERAVRIGRSMNDDGSFRSVSHDELDVLRRHATSFADLLGYQIASLSISGPEGTEFVSAEIVTSNYFRSLKTPPTIGGGFNEDASDETAVVISDRFWRRRFGADRSIVGRGVSINNQAFTIIGVAPRGFAGMFRGVAVDIWVPSVRPRSDARPDPRIQDSLLVIGVLDSNTSIATAQTELQELSQRMSELNPRHDRARGLVIADARGIHPALARGIRPFALTMMTIGAVVLLIVCANVASLLLARAGVRRGEFAVRVALGAARHRVIAQLLVESGFLAMAGAALGVVLSFWAVRSINALTLVPGPTGAPVFLDLRLDQHVLIFTGIVTMLTTVAFGLLPAVQGTRLDVMSALKAPSWAPDRRRSRWRAALVVVQVAVSVVLMVGAVLLLRSVRNSTRVDLGFDPDPVAVVSFNLEPLGYDRGRAQLFYAELLRRSRALPGVERAALADFIPMGGRGARLTIMNPASTSPSPVSVAYNRVSDDYFATLAHPLIRGRGFTPRDRIGAPLVAIVNETAARRLWPGEDAVGKRLRIVTEAGDPGTEREVIAIAKDANYRSFGGEVGPFLFIPVLEGLGPWQALHVRAQNTKLVLEAINALAREMDRSVVPLASQTMREAMAFALVPAEIARILFAVAGVIALLLATGGLYGLVCYSLQQRFKEMAIRVALGASHHNVLRIIVGGTLWLTLLGVSFGILLALGAMRVLSSLLIGVSAHDLLTFAGVAALMFAIAFAAAYVAVRKGLSVDPVAVLKYE